jgi:DUF1680 family protein
VFVAFTTTSTALANRLGNAPKAPVMDRVPDRFVPVPLDRDSIGGILGERMRINIDKRLLKVDEDAILSGFQHPPGKQAWIGEHAGKFIDAASNAWAYSGDARLKEKLDRVVRALIAAQHSDGYLGTYTDEHRWTSWDVWTHKYDLIGLLRYHEITGDAASLKAARKIGDLLCRTFGDSPGQRDILKSGEHVGMAATSVLEPMCNLYRWTGDEKYLALCRYIVRSWEREGGPKLISSLTARGRVYGTANNKAYEMLSNLVGLCELYRLTGDEALLKPALNAWQDIVAHRLYPTGTSSSGEFFCDDDVLPASAAANVGEGCVTVTWMQLNWQLLRLTGETRYADELERSTYNALLGAQHAESGDVCYFTPLDGRRTPRHDINCCLSSVPRGIAMIPRFACGVRDVDGAIQLNLYSPGEYRVTTRDENGPVDVTLKLDEPWPAGGTQTITLASSRKAKFPLVLRAPSWSQGFVVQLDHERLGPANGELRIERTWDTQNLISIDMPLRARIVPSDKTHAGQFAIQRGPQMLVASGTDKDVALNVDPSATTVPLVETAEGVFVDAVAARPEGAGARLRLVPFADAQACRVWLPPASELPSGSAALGGAVESQSRKGKLRGEGPICDGNTTTFRSTDDGKLAAEDWFAITFPQPVRIARVSYAHGESLADGGWFDTSQAKPRIEARRTADGPWEPVATIDDYPGTDAEHVPALAAARRFEVRLGAPIDCVAIRVIGTPAHGNHPGQSFVTCGELAAYER